MNERKYTFYLICLWIGLTIFGLYYKNEGLSEKVEGAYMLTYVIITIGTILRVIG